MGRRCDRSWGARVWCRAARSGRGQAFRDPAGEALLQIECIEAGCAQVRGDALADLPPMDAVYDHLACAGQVLSPLLDLIRVAMAGGDDEFACRCKIGGTPDVQERRCCGCTEPAVKVRWRD